MFPVEFACFASWFAFEISVSNVEVPALLEGKDGVQKTSVVMLSVLTPADCRVLAKLAPHSIVCHSWDGTPPDLLE